MSASAEKGTRLAGRAPAEAATEAVWFCARQQGRPTEFLRLRDRECAGLVAALCATARSSPSLKTGESGRRGAQPRRRSMPNPRTGRRHRHDERDSVRFRVTDTQKRAGDVSVHLGVVEAGELKPGIAARARGRPCVGTATRANHSQPICCHEALRQVLGDHVAQKAPMVAPDRLRFDFSHPKPMSAEEVEASGPGEHIVLQDSPVTAGLDGGPTSHRDRGRARCSAKSTGDEVRRRRDGRGRQPHGVVGRALRRHPCGRTGESA